MERIPGIVSLTEQPRVDNRSLKPQALELNGSVQYDFL